MAQKRKNIQLPDFHQVIQEVLSKIQIAFLIPFILPFLENTAYTNSNKRCFCLLYFSLHCNISISREIQNHCCWEAPVREIYLKINSFSWFLISSFHAIVLGMVFRHFCILIHVKSRTNAYWSIDIFSLIVSKIELRIYALEKVDTNNST